MDLEICMTLFIPSSDKSEMTALSSIRVPKDERIGPPIFQLEDRWRTREGPQDQHRISSPLFLLTTPPPWSSPVLQHNQLEDNWRTVGGPQDQDLRTSSSSPIRLMHLYRIVLQNSYKTGYFLLFIAIINIIKNQNKWITLNYKILFYVL